MFIAGAPCETVLSVWTVRCKSVHGNIFFFCWMCHCSEFSCLERYCEGNHLRLTLPSSQLNAGCLQYIATENTSLCFRGELYHFIANMKTFILLEHASSYMKNGYGHLSSAC